MPYREPKALNFPLTYYTHTHANMFILGAEKHNRPRIEGSKKNCKLDSALAEMDIDVDAIEKEDVELKAQIQKAQTENQDLHGLYQDLRGDWEQIRGEYHGIL